MQVKDLGEVLEIMAQKLQPQAHNQNTQEQQPHPQPSNAQGEVLITKIDGVVYYLKESIKKCQSTKAKDQWLNQWKSFVLAQQNHFFKLELVEKTKRALGIDIHSTKLSPQKNNDIYERLMSYILNHKDCAYIASEYLDGSELGEWAGDYRSYISGAPLSLRAQKLQWSVENPPKNHIASFRKLLGFVLLKHYDELIINATLKKDFSHARALSHKKLELKRVFLN